MGRFINANYRFSLGGINFSVDIDNSLSSKHTNTAGFEENEEILHYHSIHELFFVFDEQMSIATENKTEFYQNEVVCIPPKIRHMSRRSLDFRILFSFSEKERGDRISKVFRQCFASKTIFGIPITAPELKAYFDTLCTYFYNPKNELSTECVISLLKLIFSRIIEGLLPEEKKEPTNVSTCINLNLIIHEAMIPGNDPTLSNVAEFLHLSKKQASRVIQKYYGKSLKQVIIEEKLYYATYLLSSTDLPISEIAFKCNFNSTVNFHAVFKKNLGCTPLQYRKRQMQSDALSPTR